MRCMWLVRRRRTSARLRKTCSCKPDDHKKAEYQTNTLVLHICLLRISVFWGQPCSRNIRGRNRVNKKRMTRVEILAEPRMRCQARTYICNFVLKKCRKVRVNIGWIQTYTVCCGFRHVVITGSEADTTPFSRLKLESDNSGRVV